MHIFVDVDVSELVLEQKWYLNNVQIKFIVVSENILKHTALAYRLDAKNPGIIEISVGDFAAAAPNDKYYW